MFGIREAVLAERICRHVHDGVRDLPDVSLFSSFGPWKHGYMHSGQGRRRRQLLRVSDVCTGIGSINVANLVKGWNAGLTATPGAGPAPLPVKFRAEGLAFPMTYTMNFGDGSMGPVMRGSCTTGSGGAECTGYSSHKYTVDGIYSAMLLNAANVTLGTVTITVGGNFAGPGAGPTPMQQ